MPRTPIRIRGIQKAFERIFGKKAKAPQGLLAASRSGSGYFGAAYSGIPRMGEGLAFHLMATPQHFEKIGMVRKYSWVKPGAICSTGLWLFPVDKQAIITVIQPTADLKKAGLPSSERGRYRYAEIATTITAIEHCRRKGIRLFAVHPQNYEPIHRHTGEMSVDIPHYYRQTLENAAKGLGMKWKEVRVEGSFWAGYARFFGGKILELVKE